MPVLQNGRIMPLDTFARTQVKKICGDVNPMIGRLGTLTANDRKSLSDDEIQQWVKKNQPRRFLAAKLLYAWTIEPENWEDVPFLYATNAELRSEWLGVPLTGEDGSRLQYVSPQQIRAADKFQELVNEVEAREAEAQQKKESPHLSALQQSAKDLAEAFILYEQMSFDPLHDDGRRWIAGDVSNLSESWTRFQAELTQLPVFEPNPQMFRLAQQTHDAMLKLADIYRPMQTKQPALAKSDAAAGDLRRLSSQLAAEVDALAKSRVPDGHAGMDADEIVGDRQIVARSARAIALEAAKIRWGLYDAAGEAIFVVPALEPTALEADRHRSEIHPWISLYALLEGSPDLLQGYPQDGVRQVRSAWGAARDAYSDRGAADRGERFSAAMRQFTAGLRGLAAEVEPIRTELKIIERDKGLLAKTAYPRATAIDAEVFYNRLDPFHWAWIASLAAAGVLGLSCLVLRKLLFWLGAGTLIASVCLLAGGFTVRIFITHWAPVTSMFETMVWVAMCVALLTLWLNFLPLLGPASETAWGWTAIPGSWEDKRRPDAEKRGQSPFVQSTLRAVPANGDCPLFPNSTCRPARWP